MAYCQDCESEVPDGSTFCPECGTELPGDAGTVDEGSADTRETTESPGPADEGHPDGRDAEDTELNLPANQAAPLAYLLGLVSGIAVFVVEEENQFVRFHAAQSIAFSVVVVVVYFVLTFVQATLRFVPVFGRAIFLLFGLVWTILGLGLLGIWLVLMYKAYAGGRFELPVLGDFASSLATE